MKYPMLLHRHKVAQSCTSLPDPACRVTLPPSQSPLRVLSGVGTDRLYIIVPVSLFHLIRNPSAGPGFPQLVLLWMRKGKKLCSCSSKKKYIPGHQFHQQLPGKHMSCPTWRLLIHFFLCWFAWFTKTCELTGCWAGLYFFWK